MTPLTSSSSSGSNVTERRREDGETRREETGNDVTVDKNNNNKNPMSCQSPSQQFSLLRLWKYCRSSIILEQETGHGAP